MKTMHSLLTVLATVSLSSAQVAYPFGYAANYGYAAYGIPATTLGTPASTAKYVANPVQVRSALDVFQPNYYAPSSPYYLGAGSAFYQQPYFGYGLNAFAAQPFAAQPFAAQPFAAPVLKAADAEVVEASEAESEAESEILPIRSIFPLFTNDLRSGQVQYVTPAQFQAFKPQVSAFDEEGVIVPDLELEPTFYSTPYFGAGYPAVRYV